MPTTPEPVEQPVRPVRRVVEAVARPVTHQRTRTGLLLAIVAALAALAPSPADALAAGAAVLVAFEAGRR